VDRLCNEAAVAPPRLMWWIGHEEQVARDRGRGGRSGGGRTQGEGHREKPRQTKKGVV
jgi:hypothetical protein